VAAGWIHRAEAADAVWNPKPKEQASHELVTIDLHRLKWPGRLQQRLSLLTLWQLCSTRLKSLSLQPLPLETCCGADQHSLSIRHHVTHRVLLEVLP
jgi:hypothetical protein